MLILSDVRKLYDGTSSTNDAISEHVDVWIEDGRVTEVRPHSDDPTGENVRRIDCSRWVITPGLIDCHSHVTLAGPSEEDVDVLNSQEGLIRIERILFRTLVDGGVTTARDVGGATNLIKRLIDDGVMLGPRLRIAICMLSTTGGHGDFRGPDRCHGEVSRLWPPGPGRPSSIVDGPWDCRKRVREIAACGADLIKLCTSPGVLSPGDRLEHQDFSPEEIEAICTEAAARGLRVAAHAHSKAGIELAIDNGVHDIQHVSFMDERLADRAASAGCIVTPTSWVISELVKTPGLPALVAEKASEVQDVHAQATEACRSAGLKILAGTDPVLHGMHGRNYLEIVHLEREGLPALEAWHSMTGLPAQEIGLEDTGRIEAGQRADLLAWDADVLERPALTDQGTLVEVVKDGFGHRGGLPDLPQRTFADTARELIGRQDVE